MALLGAITVIFFLAIIFGAVSLQAVAGFKRAHQRTDLHQAFYAAETGVDWTIFQLRSLDQWIPNAAEEHAVTVDGTTDGEAIGSFSVQLLDLTGAAITGRSRIGREVIRIRSQGWDAAKKVYRIIEADVAVENPARYLVSTLGDLYIRSGAHVTADVLCQNFFFEINESLSDGDQAKIIDVDGNIYYTQKIFGQDDPAVLINPANELAQKDSVSFAGVDLERYRTTAETLVEAGTGKALYYSAAMTPVSIDLNNYGQSADNSPQLIFAEGDVSVSGTYSYPITIVANGNITITGDVEPVEGQSARPQIGLLAKQDVIIPESVTGDMNIEALILADGGGEDAYGIFQAKGNKNAKGKLTFSGSIAVRGEAGSGLRTAIDLDAFSAREYNHFPNLTNGYNIPFSPFMVNLISWREVDPIPYLH